MKAKVCFFLAGGLAVLPFVVKAQTLQVTQDSYVVPSSPINYGLATTVQVGSGTANVGLIQFDLTSLPASGSVGKAMLVLFVTKLSAAGSITVSQAATPWAEATVTGQNAPSGGGLSSSAAPAGASSDYVSVDVTNIVNSWLAGAPNNGLLIAGSGGINVAFDSKESTTTSHPATLTVSGATSYGYVFNTSPEFVPLETDINFDSNGPLSGVFHVPSTPSITLANTGVYTVTFSVSCIEPCQFALFQNGIQVTGATYGSGSGTQQNNGQAIVVANAGDTFTLRNHSSAAAVDLQFLAGGTQVNVNASVMFQKIQ